MSYVLLQYTETTRPLIAIYRLGIRDGNNYYEAAPILGTAVYRDMHPQGRGSENVLAPITAEDMDTLQSHMHDDREGVIESHVPEHVVQDADLYHSLLAPGRAAVRFNEDSERWEMTR
ncbi:hypothetical protein [Curtobacterium sp. MCBD17_032]|uniref:hypothetical protein n=1 Tax=Curtobacterium sp. MCBD17_032 TaxID=2175659 RepID=UPI000DAA873E|nr:hypothetical protein [Curtobacterium sp. MCBD17_032]PZE81088.1 hypothetical protein DEI91_13275 [Curtobacterium sp. MCBD17_032]